MENYVQELESFIKSGERVIEVVSSEWERIHGYVNSVADIFGCLWFTWSAASGIKSWLKSERRLDIANPNCLSISEALKWLNSQDGNTILIMEDFHPYADVSAPINVRFIKEIAEGNGTQDGVTRILILLCPFLHVPTELEEEIAVLNIGLPDRETLGDVARKVVKQYKTSCMKAQITPKLLDSALGLTVMRARKVFARAIVEEHKLTEDEIPLIIAAKEQEINKSGLLEYYHPTEHLSEVGGLDNLKSWIRRRSLGYSERAKAEKATTPRGVLLLGVPGCGKSLVAKAIANDWGLPLLRFDLGRVFGGLVGESERNMRHALDVAKTISPCVLWIDEIEKGLSGSQSSGRTDGGTAARVLGTFLTWMQEKTEPVFVVATANDISQLPSEMTRKGRFDEIFFVDLPNDKEREDIFNIHLNRRGRNAKELGLNMNELVRATQDFSGVEIEEAINEAIYSMLEKNEKDITQKGLMDSIMSTTPLARTMAESINRLRDWSKHRARKATLGEAKAVVAAPDSVPEWQGYDNCFIKDGK